MPGQPQEAPVNSNSVWTAALFAAFNRNNTDLFAYKMLNITSAKTQVNLNFRVIVINVILLHNRMSYSCRWSVE